MNKKIREFVAKKKSQKINYNEESINSFSNNL
jgi:hypothetical protein